MIKHDLIEQVDGIAEYDLKPCQHGFDVACLFCGFGAIDGKRVWYRNKPKQLESDHVTDIRNHISPSTKVFDLDAEEELMDGMRNG